MPDYATVVWMGYPKERVPMTDVHGEAQQGGALPAVIWHDYMAAVTEGQPCVEFPQPTEPLVYRPFFGKFETMGQSGTPGRGLEPNFGLGAANGAAPNAHGKSHHGKETPAPGVAKEAPAAGAEPQAGGGAPAEKAPAEPVTPNNAQTEPGAGTRAPAGRAGRAGRVGRVARVGRVGPIPTLPIPAAVREAPRVVAPRRRDDLAQLGSCRVRTPTAATAPL